MAAGVKKADIARVFSGAEKRDLIKALESDSRVRDWLAAGVLMSTKEAAAFLGVERPRLWRWEKMGKIKPVAKTGATPLFYRPDLEALKAEQEKEREE